MNTLANKVAIVTGASSGIGYATALLFAQEGAKVVVSARRRNELDALVAQIEKSGGQAVAVAGDVKDESLVKSLVDMAVTRFGGLDIAFNNAGVTGELGPISDMSLSEWHDTLDTNLTSAFLGAKHQIPAMIERGSGALVFTSSFVGHTVGMPGMAAYAASKAGLIGLTRDLATQWTGRKNIRVNALAPGFFPSEMSDQLPAETVQMVKLLTPAGRFGDPMELAATLIWLVSDAASYVTGITVPVDGGFVMP